MKILVVIQTLGPGGTERTVLNTLPALVARGHQCIVCPLGPPYDLQPLLEQRGVEVHRVGSRHRWNLAGRAYDVADVARGFGADIVHGKLYFSELAAAMSRLRFRDAGYTVSFHNLEHDYSHVPKLKRDVRRGIEAGFLHLGIHSYSAISRAVAEHYERHLHIRPVEVIHNPVPADEIACRAVEAELPRHVDSLEGDPQWLVVPARLVSVKGHRYLIDALVELERCDGLRPRVAFFGYGPLEKELRARAEEAGLSQRIYIPGGAGLPHDQCLAAMRASTAVVLPSTFEAFGLAAAEAMSLGTPVIAGAVGGYLDVIEDGVSGRLVAPRDVSALAGALREVLTDGAKAERYGEQGAKRVRDLFSISHIVDLWEDFYGRTRTSAAG